MAVSPPLGPVFAGLLPCDVFMLSILEIVSVGVAPLFHIVKLALVLAFKAGTNALIRTVFVGYKPPVAYRANFFIRHGFFSFFF